MVQNTVVDGGAGPPRDAVPRFPPAPQNSTSTPAKFLMALISTSAHPARVKGEDSGAIFFLHVTFIFPLPSPCFALIPTACRIPQANRITEYVGLLFF